MPLLYCTELPGQAEKGEPRPVSSEGRPLPPVHKKGSRERDSVSSGAWKEMSEVCRMNLFRLLRV